VITVIAIVGVSAFFSYTSATRTFGFLGEYKKGLSLMQTARSYAVTNKQVKTNGKTYTPDRYGVYIDQKSITLFAEGDNGKDGTAFELDKFDDLVTGKDFEFEKYQFVACRLGANECDEQGSRKLKYPIYIFYKKGSGDLSVFTSEDKIPVNDNVAILFKSLKEDDKLKRYAVLFKVSGLVEEYFYPLPW